MAFDLPRMHFEAVLRHLPAGVVVYEAESGRPILGNERLAEIWGRTFTSVEDVGWFLETRAFHSSGRPYRPEEWPGVRTLRSGDAIQRPEMEIERDDGSRLTLRASSAPIFDSEGNIIAAVSSFRDVTERKRQELGRRFLTKASSILAKSLDYETTLRNVARLAIPTLGDWCAIDIVREDGRVDRLAVEHVRPEKARLAREVSRRYPSGQLGDGPVARVLRAGKPELVPEVTDDVLRALAHDEEHFRILLSAGMRSAMAVPLRARGRSLGAMFFVMAESGRRFTADDLDLADDLSLRAALAIDNARLYNEAQAASRAKSDFLAVVSHELRTPLTAVIGYAELLGLGVPDPLTDRQRDQVERIGISASHLLMLIEEILTMISLDAGDISLHPTEFAVADILHRAEVIMRPIADQKNLSLQIEPTDATMFSDAERVLQVLLNLLSNGVKFTESGCVRLEARPVGKSIEFIVSDSGTGMTPEQQDQIFDPFWQAEHPITRRAGGTGLGLTITRGLIDKLGGTMELDSEEGRGSTFVVRLPQRLKDARDIPNAPTTPAESRITGRSPKPLRP